MDENYSPALKTKTEDDAVEPEIVSGPMPGGRGEHKNENAMGRFRFFMFRIKMLFSAVIVLIALTLIIIGAALTSTVIGAVLGIPLMLAGILLIWLLFKTLTLGKTKNFFVFKRF